MTSKSPLGDAYLEATLSKVNDKRLERSLINVSSACKALIETKRKITQVSVAQYCKEELSGSPSLGTIRNDNCGYYHNLINQYVSDVKDNEGGSEPLPFQDKTMEEMRILCGLLQKEVDMYKSIIKQEHSEKIISLTKTLDQTPDERDHVEPSQQHDLSKACRVGLRELLLAESMKVVKGQYIIDVDTGEVIIPAHVFDELTNYIS